MLKRVVKYVFMFTCFLALQILLVPLLAINDVQPDFLLVGVITAALRHGSVAAILTGFAAGLLQDLTVIHLYGLQSLAKSVAGFVAGYAARNKTKLDLQLTGGIALLTAVVHNLIRDGIYYFDSSYSFPHLLIRFILPNSIYTVIFVVILQIAWPDLFRSKPRE